MSVEFFEKMYPKIYTSVSWIITLFSLFTYNKWNCQNFILLLLSTCLARLARFIITEMKLYFDCTVKTIHFISLIGTIHIEGHI